MDGNLISSKKDHCLRNGEADILIKHCIILSNLKKIGNSLHHCTNNAMFFFRTDKFSARSELI